MLKLKSISKTYSITRFLTNQNNLIPFILKTTESKLLQTDLKYQKKNFKFTITFTTFQVAIKYQRF